jgi:monoamine oxidase
VKHATTTLAPAAMPQRVIVLGAGLAGLSAAYQLTLAGHDVLVLEAKPRAGGRVHTMRTGFTDGQYVEAGAMFVQGHHPLLIGYVEMLGLEVIPIQQAGGDDISLYVRGKRINKPNLKRTAFPVPLARNERLGYMGLVGKYIVSVVQKEIGDPRAPDWPTPAIRKYGEMTLADFLKSQGASSGAIELLRLGYTDLFGDGIYSTAALDVLRDLSLTLNGPPPGADGALIAGRFPVPLRNHLRLAKGGELDEKPAEAGTYTITGGNDRFPAALAATRALSGRIVYDTAVTRIESTDDGLRVLTHSKSGMRAWDAARVICTIPFAVLRGLELAVPLSDAKREAITFLPYTSVMREFVQVRTRLWTKQGSSGTVATDLPIMYVNNQSITQPGPRGILEAYTAGVHARQRGAMSLADRKRNTLENLDLVFPGLAKQVVAYETKDWTADPWARGGYCSFEPGQMNRWLGIIPLPEDRLHFAGDHTSALPGWMEGALESGHRAATEVNSA